MEVVLDREIFLANIYIHMYYSNLKMCKVEDNFLFNDLLKYLQYINKTTNIVHIYIR